jgi:ABC-2 type transport system permease protein
MRRADLTLFVRWLGARLRAISRTPRATFFTFVFPLILLVLLNSTGSGGTVQVPGGKVDFAQYYTPSIGVYALAVSCYVAPIFGLATARELGILKRVRGTPLSPWIYVAAWLASTILVGLAAMTVMIVVSVPAFGFHVYPHLLPAAFVTAVLGAAALCALGFAIATYVRRADTAPAIANLTLFPILFLSGVFFSLDGAPEWIRTVANVFPLYHIVKAFTACFSPFTDGSGFAFRDLAVIAAWGAAGLLLAVRRFRREAEAREAPTLAAFRGRSLASALTRR